MRHLSPVPSEPGKAIEGKLENSCSTWACRLTRSGYWPRPTRHRRPLSGPSMLIWLPGTRPLMSVCGTKRTWRPLFG